MAAGGNSGRLPTVLGTIAVTAASVNVIGGFVITDRMLRMFKRGPSKGAPGRTPAKGGTMSTATVVQLLYLAASILFIVGLRCLTGPESARRGVWYAELGMLLAVVGTLLRKEIITYEWILTGMLLGGGIGTAISRADPHDEDAGANRVLARVRRPGG